VILYTYTHLHPHTQIALQDKFKKLHGFTDEKQEANGLQMLRHIYLPH